MREPGTTANLQLAKEPAGPPSPHLAGNSTPCRPSAPRPPSWLRPRPPPRPLAVAASSCALRPSRCVDAVLMSALKATKGLEGPDIGAYREHRSRLAASPARREARLPIGSCLWVPQVDRRAILAAAAAAAAVSAAGPSEAAYGDQARVFAGKITNKSGALGRRSSRRLALGQGSQEVQDAKQRGRRRQARRSCWLQIKPDCGPLSTPCCSPFLVPTCP